MIVKRIYSDDDLDIIASQINEAQWDDANEISAYDSGSLLAYLQRQDTVFVACFMDDKVVGMASARIEIKPYDQERWLYIDEVDVCAHHRRLGVGRQLMNTLFSIAKEYHCSEAWLGTELDNKSANALYRSLEPDGVENFTGFTYELDD